MLPGWKEPLQNLEFLEGSLESVADHELLKARYEGTASGSACLLALHGCNEVNKIAIEMAMAVKCSWAVIPCCIPEELYMSCPVSLGGLGANNELRYPFMCGAMACEYGAQVVTKIERLITDRHIFIAGGGVEPKQHLGNAERGPAARNATRTGGKSAGWVSEQKEQVTTGAAGTAAHPSMEALSPKDGRRFKAAVFGDSIAKQGTTVLLLLYSYCCTHTAVLILLYAYYCTHTTVLRCHAGWLRRTVV
jgi:hypothetical protein